MNPQEPSDAAAFEQELVAVERSLHDLKARYAQVQHDQAQQAALQQQHDRLQQARRQLGHPELQAELKQIQQQLDDLEVNLESRLFQWGSLREVFWQIVRFGGLGIVIGWGLAMAVLQQPQPTPQPNSTAPQSTRPH